MHTIWRHEFLIRLVRNEYACAHALAKQQLAAMYLVSPKPVNVACQVIRPGNSLAIQIPNHRRATPSKRGILFHMTALVNYLLLFGQFESPLCLLG